MLVNGVELKDDSVCLAARRNKGQFEPETFAYLETLEPSGTFSDIGAYTGIYGIWAAKRGWNVHFFEPNPTVMSHLLYNVQTAGVQGQLYRFALSEQQGEAVFYANPNTKITSAGSLEEGKGKKASFYVSTFPYTMYSTGDESVIKIDVEGHEMAVLRGMKNTLKDTKPTLIVEVLDNKQKEEVIAYTETFGYTVVGMFDGRNLILSV